VAWRLADGSVSLLQEHCSHRGSSLVYARSDGDCLRCVYHGWIYDVGGNVLDTPAEPARSVIKDKVKHPSYATHEATGVIWAYLGPKDKQPLLPNYRFTEAPAENVYVTKVMMGCNWLQGVGGERDSAHVSLLHRRFEHVAAGRAITQDLAPEYETEETDFGLRLIALRKQNDSTQQYVPIDDTHTWRFGLGYLQRAVTAADVNRAPVIDERFKKTQHMGNGYAKDRQMMTAEALPSVLARSTPSCGSIMKMGSGYMGTPSPNCFDCRCMLTTVLSAMLRATHMGEWECMASVASGRALKTSV